MSKVSILACPLPKSDYQSDQLIREDGQYDKGAEENEIHAQIGMSCRHLSLVILEKLTDIVFFHVDDVNFLICIYHLCLWFKLILIN